MRRVRHTWLAIACALIAPSLAGAQDSSPPPSRPWLRAALGVTWQPAGQDDRYTRGPLGGRGAAPLVDLDVPVSPRIAVVLEGLRGAALDGEQVEYGAWGLARSRVTHRDWLASAGVSLRVGDGRSPVRILTFAGLASRRTERSQRVVDAVLGRQPPPLPAESDTVTKFTAGIGLDLPFDISPRVRLGPTVRAHVIFDRDQNPDGTVRTGVGQVLLLGGFTLAVRF